MSKKQSNPTPGELGYTKPPAPPRPPLREGKTKSDKLKIKSNYKSAKESYKDLLARVEEHVNKNTKIYGLIFGHINECQYFGLDKITLYANDFEGHLFSYLRTEHYGFFKKKTRKYYEFDWHSKDLRFFRVFFESLGYKVVFDRGNEFSEGRVEISWKDGENQ